MTPEQRYRKSDKGKATRSNRRRRPDVRAKELEYAREYRRTHPEFRAKQAERDREYREAHKDELREKKKAYYEANKEAVRASQLRWREAHRAELSAAQQAYYRADRSRILAQHAEYRQANRDRIRAAQRASNRANPGRKAASWRKSKYDLSPEAYARMVADQDGRCAICDRARKLHVDHDHNTGLVRGLLCNTCNVALGDLDDEPSLLRAAADYIERSRQLDNPQLQLTLEDLAS